MKKVFLCWLVCHLTTGLQAQQATPAAQGSPAPIPSLPSGPLIKPVPDRMNWLVTINNKTPASTEKPAANTKPADTAKMSRTIGGQKVGPVEHVWTTTDNGKEDAWSDGKTLLVTNLAWKVPLFSVGAPEEFPRPGWISRKNIKEIKKQGNKEYWIFRDRVFPGGENITKDMVLPGENLEDLKVDATAVIDAETRLPVGVQTGEETMTFKFEPLPPEATLSLPPELTELIAKRQQKIEASTRRAVRP